MNGEMNKPLTMAIKDVKVKIVNACNESGLPPAILDLIMWGIYSEIHYAAERQTESEEFAYLKSLEKNAIKDSKGEGNEEK